MIDWVLTKTQSSMLDHWSFYIPETVWHRATTTAFFNWGTLRLPQHHLHASVAARTSSGWLPLGCFLDWVADLLGTPVQMKSESSGLIAVHWLPQRLFLLLREHTQRFLILAHLHSFLRTGFRGVFWLIDLQPSVITSFPFLSCYFHQSNSTLKEAPARTDVCTQMSNNLWTCVVISFICINGFNPLLDSLKKIENLCLWLFLNHIPSLCCLNLYGYSVIWRISFIVVPDHYHGCIALQRYKVVGMGRISFLLQKTD